MTRWWRAYGEALHDPKIVALTDQQHRAWFNLLCIASKTNGKLPKNVRLIATELRVQPRKALRLISELKAFDLFEENEHGDIIPHNWAGRQYKSDLSTPRVKRFRNARRNVSETPPENTETENTETEKILEARKRATRLEKDWWPSEANIQYALSHGLSLDRLNTEGEKFRNYWTAKAGKDAAKLDWDATWQNWILKATENGHAKPRQSLGDRASELAEQARQLEFAESHRRKDEPLRGH